MSICSDTIWKGRQISENEGGDKLADDINNENNTYRLSEGLKMRTIVGENLLMPVGKTAAKIHQTAVLNKEAAKLVSLMTGEFTIEDIVKRGMQIYKVEEEVLRKDVEKLVMTLGKAGMLIGKEFERRSAGETKTISGTARISADGKVISSTSSDIQKETSPSDTGSI